MKRKKSRAVHPHYGGVIATAFVVAAMVQVGTAAVESPLQASFFDVVPASFEDIADWWVGTQGDTLSPTTENVFVPDQESTDTTNPPTDDTAPSADDDCDEELVSLLREWTPEQLAAIRALADVQGDTSVGALVTTLEVLGRLPVGSTMEQVWSSEECIARL